MTFSKKTFEKAKQNAFDRLTGWATETKVPDRDYGIPRLQEDFKHVFKKIEWSKREKPTQIVKKEKETKVCGENVHNVCILSD